MLRLSKFVEQMTQGFHENRNCSSYSGEIVVAAARNLELHVYYNYHNVPDVEIDLCTVNL